MFRRMYFVLFHAITNALQELDNQNIGAARKLLMQAQIDSEEIYMQGEHQSSENIIVLPRNDNNR